MNRGIDADTPSMTTHLEPHLSFRKGKTNSWDAPMRIEEKDEKVPIALGEKPRPPLSTGVDRKSASVPQKNFSSIDVAAKFVAAMMTLGTRRVRNDSGLSMLPFRSPVMRAETFHAPFLNRLERGNGSVIVSFRKMLPTSHAISRIAEQMAQGRK